MSQTMQMCECGKPLHYSDPSIEAIVRKLIDRLGERVTVSVAGTRRAYKIPRHYVALHGLAAADLDQLAEQFGWELA